MIIDINLDNQRVLRKLAILTKFIAHMPIKIDKSWLS